MHLHIHISAIKGIQNIYHYLFLKDIFAKIPFC